MKRLRDPNEDEDEQNWPLKRRASARLVNAKPPFGAWVKTMENAVRTTRYEKFPEKGRGSKRVTATLGPELRIERANDANSSKPRTIVEAREKYPKHSFKAGHMLNCDLGGDGRTAGNLTILTAKANTSMTKYDNKLKTAVSKLRALYELIHKYSKAKVANSSIKVVIVAKGKWATEVPDLHICQKVKIDVRFVRGSEIDEILRDAELDDKNKSEIESAMQQVSSYCKKACGTVSNNN